MKKILLILSHSPYANPHSKDALDIALTSAAFEQEVSILLTQDAVFLLLADQQPQNIGHKNPANTLKALPMYDIEQLYVDQAAASQGQLNKELISSDIPPINYLGQNQIADLIRSHDVVLRF